HGVRLRAGHVSRLGGNHLHRHADRGTDHRGPRFRPRAGADPALVRHPVRGEPADLVPDAALRLCAVLHPRHRSAGDRHPRHLSRHYPVRYHPADRPAADHRVSAAGALAAGQTAWLIKRSFPCRKLSPPPPTPPRRRSPSPSWAKDSTPSPLKATRILVSSSAMTV